VSLSQLVCPLFGRFVSLRLFDPSLFEFDSFVVNVRGLGRGRGFAVFETLKKRIFVSKYSSLIHTNYDH